MLTNPHTSLADIQPVVGAMPVCPFCLMSFPPGYSVDLRMTHLLGCSTAKEAFQITIALARAYDMGAETGPRG